MELLEVDWIKAFNVIGFSFIMVFLLLLLIVIVLNIFGRLFSSEAKLPKSSGIDNAGNKLSDNDLTAIGLALYLYHENEHDEESNILTFKRTNRYYSPWNSKHSV